MHTTITIEELDAVLTAAPIKLPALDAGIDIDELLEIASEADERGPLAAIKGLLEGLRVRHGDDGFLDQLLQPAERSQCRARMDCADATGMPGAPGL